MNTYKIDFTTKTIIITKEFADKASNPSSAEYHISNQKRTESGEKYVIYLTFGNFYCCKICKSVI